VLNSIIAGKAVHIAIIHSLSESRREKSKPIGSPAVIMHKFPIRMRINLELFAIAVYPYTINARVCLA